MPRVRRCRWGTRRSSRSSYHSSIYKLPFPDGSTHKSTNAATFEKADFSTYPAALEKADISTYSTAFEKAHWAALTKSHPRALWGPH